MSPAYQERHQHGLSHLCLSTRAVSARLRSRAFWPRPPAARGSQAVPVTAAPLCGCGQPPWISLDQRLARRRQRRELIENALHRVWRATKAACHRQGSICSPRAPGPDRREAVISPGRIPSSGKSRSSRSARYAGSVAQPPVPERCQLSDPIRHRRSHRSRRARRMQGSRR